MSKETQAKKIAKKAARRAERKLPVHDSGSDKVDFDEVLAASALLDEVLAASALLDGGSPEPSSEDLPVEPLP